MTIEIPLTKGQVAIVDDQDADLAQYKWYAQSRSNLCNFIARRKVSSIKKKDITELMHRVILARKLDRPLLSSEIVDHKNRNPLDNRRENLRLATFSQNNSNEARRRTNTSGFKGVYFSKRDKTWAAQIRVGKIKTYLGRFFTYEEAYDAYCKAAVETFGEFVMLDDIDHTKAEALINQYGKPRSPFVALITSKSGCKGACWDKRRQKWRALIQVNKKVFYLGSYDTPQEAHEAYKKAYIDLHNESE